MSDPPRPQWLPNPHGDAPYRWWDGEGWGKAVTANLHADAPPVEEHKRRGLRERRQSREEAEEAQRKLLAARKSETWAHQMVDVIEGRARIDCPLILKPGEVAIYTLPAVGLFEPRSGGGHYSGKSSGVSVPMGHSGVRIRVGQSKGRYVRDPEVLTVIDTGTATVTDQRMVFQGNKRVVEWSWSKLVGFSHDEKRPQTAVQVSNRQKVSGISYPGVDVEKLRLALDLAVGISQGYRSEAVQQLRDAFLAPQRELGSGPAPAESDRVSEPEVEDPPIQTEVPPPPAPVDVPTVPPTWAADPTHRHELRYWDGTSWTAHVSDQGLTSDDPM